MKKLLIIFFNVIIIFSVCAQSNESQVTLPKRIYVGDTVELRYMFYFAADFFDEVKNKYFANDNHFCERSWGMSHDYKIAISCRSTMIRIGTNIFGPRVY